MTRNVTHRIAFVWVALTAVLACPTRAAPPQPATDKITFMGTGVDWDGAADGGGAALGWLHTFKSSAVVGAAAEHQRLGDTRWTFGTLSAAKGYGPTRFRSNVYGEIRGGGGDDDLHSFTYATYVLGLVQNVTTHLAFQLEDRQIDIDRTHGNLPKLGVQYLFGPRFLMQAAFSQSTSPHTLGTKLWTVRGDYYGKWVNVFAGGASGRATPVVLGQTGVPIPGTGLDTNEGYIGVTKPLSRVDVTLLADYLELGDLKRTMVTLSGAVYLNGSAAR